VRPNIPCVERHGEVICLPARLVVPDMRDHTTQDHGRRGLWIAAGLIALVVIIALIALTGGGGGGGGGGGY